MTTAGLPRSRVRTAADSLRSELIKLATLPPLQLTALGIWAVGVLLGLAFAGEAIHGATIHSAAGMTYWLDAGLKPVRYAQAGFIILGTLAATSEYSGGQIRTSLVAVPRRTELQVSKVIALVLAAAPVALCDVILGIGAARAGLGSSAGSIDLSRTAQAVAGATAYLTLTALLSFAVATMMRRNLPSVVTLIGYYFIVGPLVRDRAALSIYLPDTAGYSMWFSVSSETGGALGALGTLAGSAVVMLWTLVAVTIAVLLFRRRDA